MSVGYWHVTSSNVCSFNARLRLNEPIDVDEMANDGLRGIHICSRMMHLTLDYTSARMDSGVTKHGLAKILSQK